MSKITVDGWFAFSRRCLLVMLLGLLGGCDSTTIERLEGTARSLGLADEPPPPAEAIDIICSVGAGVCTRDRATTTIDAAATFIAERPGSQLRVSVLRGAGAGVRILGTITSPAAPSGSDRVVRARRTQFVATTRAYFGLLLDPVFSEPRSPYGALAEGLSQVGLATTGNNFPRRIVVLADPREEGWVADIECRPPPPATFLARLRRRRLLAPGSLAHVRIYFTFTGGSLREGYRCASSVSRSLGAQDLWRVALGTAGAAAHFDTELTAFNPEPQQRDQ